MEFHEKLQELRKNRGVTQEELAEDLYVSRTAISKWESGRGYPNIESLKQISSYYGISIDDLLSGEELLTLAEKENQDNIGRTCGLLFGIVDVCSCLLIGLPLYPKFVDGYVYSVNLMNYGQTGAKSLMIYWIMFAILIALGLGKTLLMKREIGKFQRELSELSIGVGIMAVALLTLFREPYASTLAFFLLIAKAFLFFKGEGRG